MGETKRALPRVSTNLWALFGSPVKLVSAYEPAAMHYWTLANKTALKKFRTFAQRVEDFESVAIIKFSFFYSNYSNLKKKKKIHASLITFK